MRYLFKLLTHTFIITAIILSLLLLREREIFDTRGLVQIDPIPKTWELIKEKRYADANDYLSYFMQFDYVKDNPKAVELLKALNKKRDSFEYKRDKVIEGIISGKSDETVGKISAIASDFLVIGDIRDLTIEGNHYFKGDREVDKVVVALSTLGLVATVSTIYTLGASSSIKSSISILKYARRVNRIPKWLEKAIIREAKVAKETKSLKSVKGILEPISNLYERVGLKGTLNLLKDTRNLSELKGVAKLSKRFGKNSSELLKITGAKSAKVINSMPSVKPKNILYASSYGDKGILALKRMGESKFLKRVKIVSRVSKTAYKGNFDTLIAKLLKMVPTSLLLAISLLGLFYYLFKLLSILKLNFKIPKLA